MRRCLYFFALSLFVACCVGPVAAQTPGNVDSSFDPETAAGDVLWGLGIQGDGKILAAGRRMYLSGTYAGSVYRFNADGTMDNAFVSGSRGSDPIAIPQVNTLALQANGSVLLGGQFTYFDDISRVRLARLGPDGALDAGFTPSARDTVNSILVQPDGKVLIGGSFTDFMGSGQNYLVRLHPDGSVDTSFSSGTGPNAKVKVLALAPDGKILLGGDFTAVDSATRARCARLNLDGSVDNLFDPGAGPDSTVEAIAIQADGKVLIGGAFTMVGTTSRQRLARLNTNGTLDESFADPGCGGFVYAIAVQSNGKILAGGRFNNVGASGIRKIARFNPNGAVDPSFDAAAGAGTTSDAEVRAIRIQSDGKIVVAGKFTVFGNLTRCGIARLFGDPVLPVISESCVGDLFTIRVPCSPGQLNVIEVSSDLVNWQAILTTVPTTDTITYSERLQSGSRFFRVALPR